MRYPNTRYGNPEELRYYTQGLSIKVIAKDLKRSEKSVKAWLDGERKIPFWVPELLRLRHMERDLTMRQMGFGDQRLKLGLVSGTIINFPERKKNQKMRTLIAALICIALTQTSYAQGKIYKCIVKGKTIYSESPCKENAYNVNVFEVNHDRVGTVSPDRETIDSTRARIRADMNAPGAQGISTGTTTRTTTTTSNKTAVCSSIEDEIRHMDARARQPLTGWEQDQIKQQKSDAQKRKNQYGCG